MKRLPNITEGSIPQDDQIDYDSLMHRYVGRRERRTTSMAARRVARPVVVARAITGYAAPAVRGTNAPHKVVEFPQEFGPDPYIDYGRLLTPEGGILIAYKDIDERLRHILWGGLAWTGFTGFEAWLLPQLAPSLNSWVGFALLLVAGLINWFIVSRPVEVYRKIEIRPDCMIIEGGNVFWARHMENGVPAFHPNDEGHYVLSGVYGSRFVEYLTIRRFDEFDRAPEVFAAHLADAMKQQWMNRSGG